MEIGLSCSYLTNQIAGNVYIYSSIHYQNEYWSSSFLLPCLLVKLLKQI